MTTNGSNDSSYASITKEFTIDKAALTVTANSHTIYVDGTPQTYKYTMTGWQGNDESTVTLTVVFASCSHDVPTSAYCYNAVARAAENEITNGTGDGTTFSPDLGYTRAQIVTFLYRCMA